MSICRPMMTSAMPQATTSVGASRARSESNGLPLIKRRRENSQDKQH